MGGRIQFAPTGMDVAMNDLFVGKAHRWAGEFNSPYTQQPTTNNQQQLAWIILKS
jgi:hypothetical protein